MRKPFKVILTLCVLIAAISVIWYIKSYSETDQSRLTLFGNIDIRQVQLTFHDPEHIAQMYVKEGDQVTKGQLLAIQDLARFQYTLDSAQAKMDAQQQVVNRLLNGTRPEDIRRAKADVKSAQAEVAYTKKELQRLQSLVKKKLTSKESVDRARSEYIAAREKMHALQEQLDLAVIGPRKEDIAAAQAILKANESSLKLAKKVWQDGHLYAPSDGIIQDRILEPGDMANSQSPIYTLALVNPVWARVYVSEQDLGKIHQGMRAQIYSDSYPDKSYSGWVGYISPTAEFTPKAVETVELRTSLVYQVRVFACNAQNELRLGMPITVSIDLTATEDIKTKATSCTGSL
ncbi:efflux RND transporter periplasmic adaptor subunit [methanotrophic endosymbiont of Bathymodiolus puteoserpentis (Logatchev)]|jgi:HlyD family secretion protein|uniref:efflux RND transporter periplasmic adaptor subunit n=1 Tax=methanotrophic endosymbiont of Bathymodiolus puteoserpentis (Logatchev) TaxID=343235 RepID=UPI0013CB5724|nr:efflux RND transporter periplasmic adaptor subunit [methanotrophic endosymbiont of Bathymodiolus puteoserpentis (Logatchev)]SHE19530.1 Predicted membrane fusion protein (MFP) component of efflux pump, membrane anchor protein YbhG [methanotrophic endosymbiont of Bathymodiolus puteoserpentis (Logatchev)]